MPSASSGLVFRNGYITLNTFTSRKSSFRFHVLIFVIEQNKILRIVSMLKHKVGHTQEHFKQQRASHFVILTVLSVRQGP